MLPLNPFLRAFFRSTLPSQCSPVFQHILLVPSTEFLLSHRDRETQVSYSDLTGSEEFLASHVLRIPNPTTTSASPNKKDKSQNLRDSKGKAKQYTTLNGRTIILKDSYLYSNKGFKNLSQAQILGDALFYPDTIDATPWVVYYISRPLVGSPELVKFTVPVKTKLENGTGPDASKARKTTTSQSATKKEVKSFGDLMNQFPMISRQMQPGLERIFNEFRREVEKPLPPLPPPEQSPATIRKSPKRRSSVSSLASLTNSIHSSLTHGANGIFHSNLELRQHEDELRHALEVAITAAIDLFQMVDKQQLSLLGSSTDLTGATVERMIERYVTEQLHDNILFPRICASRKTEDHDLEARVKQMGDIDISQVGLSIETGRAGKKELALRLATAVDIFKKMGVSSSAEEMLEILLETHKSFALKAKPKNPTSLLEPSTPSEKSETIMTISADTLVSLLLVVVIRSPVRHLQARLLYMRHFIFIADVESGEFGYALSTFEAVLSYLSHDSSGLRRSSLRNRRLWQATKDGQINDMKAILEPDATSDLAIDSAQDDDKKSSVRSEPSVDDLYSEGATTLAEDEPLHQYTETNGSLAHVFPFQRPSTPLEPTERPRVKKRVSVQSRSTSISSMASIRSLPLTIDSVGSNFDGDLSIETLAQTQGPNGDSVLMMAIQSHQEKALKYLLNLRTYFTIDNILDDENNSGTTLLSAAIQTGDKRIAEMVLDYVIDHVVNDDTVGTYLRRQDENGRCAAHYLFDYPGLMSRISQFVPWTLKDKNGQTPLFALCRSYDHEDYKWMVETALSAACKAQADGQPLRLGDHVDNKGNTLLHIINEPTITAQLLDECDSDVNASNDKAFTPLMVASKYGRTEMVRTLFNDPRVDLFAKDHRGLSATELAKDDDVRNRIDDLILLATPPTSSQRVTGVVRSYFIEDGTLRFVVKSAARNPNATVTITTCRRTLLDFENLARWLALEHPASWLPRPTGFISAFLLPTRPSRSISRDTQLRLDTFLKTLLSHPTFGQHEMVWEFFLVPDMDPSVLADRSKRKADLRTEMVRDEYEPITDVREVDLFITYARDSVRSLHIATKSVIRRANAVRQASSDLYIAASLAGAAFSSVEQIPSPHNTIPSLVAKCLIQREHSPFTAFFYDIQAISHTTTSLLQALALPSKLINDISQARKSVDRAASSFRRAATNSSFIPLPLLDDARARAQKEASEKIDKALDEQMQLGKELRYSQQTVALEMAQWQEQRVGMGRKAIKNLVRAMVVKERERLEGLKRVGRVIGMAWDKDGKRLK